MTIPYNVRKACAPVRQFYLIIAAGFFAVALISSCRSRHLDNELPKNDSKQVNTSGITIEYPGDSTLFPPEIPAPRFIWKDADKKSDQWYVTLLTRSGDSLYSGIVKFSEWRPDSVTWINIKMRSGYEPVSFLVAGTGTGLSDGKNPTSKISFSFSSDSVTASVFFRAVPLPNRKAARHINEVEWYKGNISGGEPQRILKNMPVCMNCHSFSRNGLIAMDIDYAKDKGSYIIVPLKDTVNLSIDKIISWNDYKRETGKRTSGMLSQISPGGRYVLSTLEDKTISVGYPNREYSLLFFPVNGIIGFYDRNSGEFSELPGASDRKFVQSNPIWSPDGNEIIFARTEGYKASRIESILGKFKILSPVLKVVRMITEKHKVFKFSLYSIPFNEGKGGLAVPVNGAYGNNKSNFFAKFSPDGKWIVFCQAENFMLLQPDSKLFIMPAGGGIPRLMKCNTGNMNSWHSWSPNSRWLVFSSKLRGPYTQLYLTHIDENGNDSPPVFLENMALETRAANIPEFFDNRIYNLKSITYDLPLNPGSQNRLSAQSNNHIESGDSLRGLKRQ